MDDILVDLKIKKIIQEYNFLKSDEDYKKEIININQSVFLNIVSEELSKIDPLLIKEPSKAENKSKDKPKIDLNEVSENDKVKVKKIYREIVKLTHPDKIKNEELNEIYLNATIAYDKFDLFELYFIATNLNIKIKLTLDESKILSALIDAKKDEISNIEKSFIWLWVNAESDSIKDNLVTNFIKSHYLI